MNLLSDMSSFFLTFSTTDDLNVLVCLPLSAAGELSVRVIDSLLGTQPKLWEFSEKTGTEEGAWQHVDLPIGVRKHRFQVSLFLLGLIDTDIVIIFTLEMFALMTYLKIEVKLV